MRNNYVNMRSLGWALIRYHWYPHKRKRLGHRHVQSENNIKTQGGEDGHLQPKRKTPPKKPTLPSPWS